MCIISKIRGKKPGFQEKPGFSSAQPRFIEKIHRAPILGSGISSGQDVGLPNLLGVWRKDPEQDFGELNRAVRDSDASPTQTPKDLNSLDWLLTLLPGLYF